MRLRIKSTPWQPASLHAGWPSKPYAFLLSAIFHFLTTALLIGIPAGGLWVEPKIRLRPQEQVLLLKPTMKIYWVPITRSTPALIPRENAPAANAPAGSVLRPNENVVVNRPAPKSNKQLVYQPETPSPLEKETLLPDMVAVKGSPVPQPIQAPEPPPPPEAAPPPAPKPKPKTFTLAKKDPQLPIAPAVITDAPPAITGADTRNLNAVMIAPGLSAVPTKKPPAKTYVPGSASPSAANRPPAKPTLVDTAPEIAAGGTGAAQTAVVIGLNPSLTVAAPPKGSRSAEFSTGPQKGTTATAGGTGLVIPGVAVQGREAKSALPNPAAANPNSPRFELKIPPSASSMSAPLRPASRTVPRSIESRFPDRVLYALVVAKPNLPEYRGDWTLWYAERTPSLSNNTQMRAPLPMRKVLTAVAPLPAGANEGFIQVSAVIDKSGKITGLTPLPGRFPQIAAVAVQDLAAWEFRPATRNGEAIDVDVVIEFSFRPNGAEKIP